MSPTLNRRQWCMVAGIAAAATWLSGCSTPPRPDSRSETVQTWSGRMALQLAEDGLPNRNGVQSFSASFELRGAPETGSLQLFTPMGSSVALIRWQPGLAILQQGQRQRTSASLAELVRETLGTEIPIPTVFAWLQGEARAADGWSVDLSRHAEGRITATRHTPAPAASLRLILDR